MKASIEKIKTWHGMRYAVVAPFTTEYYEEVGNKEDKFKKLVNTSESKNKKKKLILKSRTDNFAVEYKKGDHTQVAEFPVTPDGLNEAREVLKLFK